jgi:hypothetical protein
VFGKPKEKTIKAACIYVLKEADMAHLNSIRPFISSLFQEKFGSTGRTRINSSNSGAFLQAFELREGGELCVFSLTPGNPDRSRIGNCFDGYEFICMNVPKSSSLDNYQIDQALRVVERELIMKANNRPPYPLIKTVLL